MMSLIPSPLTSPTATSPGTGPAGKLAADANGAGDGSGAEGAKLAYECA